MPIKAHRAILAASVLLVGTAACSDLTVEPKSTVTSANLFNDPSSYTDYLAKIYAGLAVTGQQGPTGNGDIQGIDEGFSQYLRLYWQMEELPTDEAVIAWNDAGVQELNTQLWSSANQFNTAMYSRIFYQVSLANDFLRETADARLAARNASATLKTTVAQYRAEARFLRALSYWHGIDLFGNIPLVKETDPIGSTPPAQSDRATIYAYIESELKAIRSQLPPAGQAQYGRVDQGAVDMVLAKLHLNAKTYIGSDQSAAALTDAANIINSGAYSLDPNYRHLFSADNNTSKEFIWVVPQDGVRMQNYGGTTFLVHASVGGNMNPANFGIDGGWYGLRVRKELVQMFPSDTTVPDGRALFFKNGKSLDVTTLTDYNAGYSSRKYTNLTAAGAPGQRRDFVDTDYPMFRLGDAYLIYAEAAVRTNSNLAQALTYVNALRQRAYGDASGNVTAAQLTLPFILSERARELWWEGTRRTDQVRFGTFSDQGVWQWKGGVLAGKPTQAVRNVYPLPASELSANPKLKQNPGY